jgi:hypothetical protein
MSGIWTYDPSVQAGEDSSCLRPRGYCERQLLQFSFILIFGYLDTTREEIYSDQNLTCSLTSQLII